MYRPVVCMDNIHCGIMISVLYVHSVEIWILFLFQFKELNDIIKITKPSFNPYINALLFPFLQLFPFLCRLGYK